MGNTPNVFDFDKTLDDFLNDPVSDGTWNDIIGAVLKFDEAGNEAAASEIDAAAGQLWSNAMDDYVRVTYPFFYKATKVWRVADAAARDLLGIDDSLAVDDILWQEDVKSFWYVVSVDGPTASTWATVAVTPGLAAVLAVANTTGGNNIQVSTGDRIFNAGGIGSDAVRIEIDDEDTKPVLKLNTTGLNGELTAIHTGGRTPVGNVVGNPGDIYIRVDDESSQIYMHNGQAADNIDWEALKFVGDIDTLTEVLASGNVTGGQDISVGALDRIFGLTAPVQIETDTADTGAVSTRRSTGLNGAASRLFVGSRTPIANVTGSPGDLYARVDGVNSTLYVHTGAIANDTDWVDLDAGSAMPTLAEVLTAGNTTGGNDVEMITGDRIFGTVVPVAIETTGADTVAVSSRKTNGTNGATTRLFVGDRTPIGNVTGNPGDLYARVDTISSALYIHEGASANNTSWVDLATGGGGGSGAMFTATKSGAYTAAAGEIVKFDPSGGTFTLTFPASPGTNDRVGFKNVTDSTVEITLAGNGNTVESPLSYGVATTQLVGGNGLALSYQFDGTSWLIV